MNRLWFVLLGAVAVMTFAALVLVFVPLAVLEEVEAPAGLAPYAGAAGRRIYVREGCVYCHSQQVRDPSLASDSARGWGRQSVPADYVYDRPHLLGTMRTGPDLFDVGQRLPDRQWHLLHLYQPRVVAPWSVMPSFGYLFEVLPEGEPTRLEVVTTPPGLVDGVLVATPDASVLVDYLLKLRRDYPPPEQGGAEVARAR
jgi:cytochrome c oxidase cbb3-type subunit 2